VFQQRVWFKGSLDTLCSPGNFLLSATNFLHSGTK
jgi:hypothetical protein